MIEIGKDESIEDKSLEEVWDETFCRVCPNEIEYDDLNVEVEVEYCEDYWNYGRDEPDQHCGTEREVIDTYTIDITDFDMEVFKKFVAEFFEKDIEDITKEDLERIDEDEFYDYLREVFRDDAIRAVEEEYR